jgi:hypothetical protein
VFQLFWSTNSMQSEQVRQEWEHALSLGRSNFIRPTYWEQPMPTSDDPLLPPEPLRQLHFHALSTPLDIAAETALKDDPSRPAEYDHDGQGSANASQPSTGASASLLICPHCGGANPRDSSFCSQCGSYLPSQGQTIREHPPPAAAMHPRDQPTVTYSAPTQSQRPAHIPQGLGPARGNSSRTWIVILVALILISAIMAFLFWKSQAATDPAGTGSISRAVATNRAPAALHCGELGP